MVGYQRNLAVTCSIRQQINKDFTETVWILTSVCARVFLQKGFLHIPWLGISVAAKSTVE